MELKTDYKRSKGLKITHSESVLSSIGAIPLGGLLIEINDPKPFFRFDIAKLNNCRALIINASLSTYISALSKCDSKELEMHAILLR